MYHLEKMLLFRLFFKFFFPRRKYGAHGLKLSYREKCEKLKKTSIRAYDP